MRYNLKRTTCISLIIGIGVGTFGALAQCQDVGKKEKRLPGNWHPLISVTKESSDVVIGVFNNLGIGTIGSAGLFDYGNVEIVVEVSLKGTLSGKYMAAYSLATNRQHKEEAPALGTKYLMFLRKIDDRGYQIYKLLDATNENVAAVMKLLMEGSK